MGCGWGRGYGGERTCKTTVNLPNVNVKSRRQELFLSSLKWNRNEVLSLF